MALKRWDVEIVREVRTTIQVEAADADEALAAVLDGDIDTPSLPANLGVWHEGIGDLDEGGVTFARVVAEDGSTIASQHAN